MSQLEPKAWTQKVQALVDQAVFHLDEARAMHKRGDHKLEDRHRTTMMRLVGEYNELVKSIPLGAKPPKLPRIS